jgi:hypothetical protein
MHVGDHCKASTDVLVAKRRQVDLIFFRVCTKQHVGYLPIPVFVTYSEHTTGRAE